MYCSIEFIRLGVRYAKHEKQDRYLVMTVRIIDLMKVENIP